MCGGVFASEVFAASVREKPNKSPEPTRLLGLRFRMGLLRSTLDSNSKESRVRSARVAHL